MLFRQEVCHAYIETYPIFQIAQTQLGCFLALSLLIWQQCSSHGELSLLKLKTNEQPVEI